MKVIGLMSGTSSDGIDAALIDIRPRRAPRAGGAHDVLRVTPLAFTMTPYSSALRSRLLAAARHGSVSEVCRLNAVLGERFAAAALRVIRKAGLTPAAVDLIGSHGHTIHHLPRKILEPDIGWLRSTLQIGEPAIIAERTGITTIADFRQRDMAAGGEGAPLAPYAHHLLLGDSRRSRLIVNIGGICNVTYLPAGREPSRIIACDTGPGNMLLDALAQRLSKGRHTMDPGGRFAAAGRVDPRLLAQLLAHPFLRRPPPKSTGREEFGEAFLERVLAMQRKMRCSLQDLLSTCCVFTAISVGSIRRWLPGGIQEVIVTGGGTKNRTLMSAFAAAFEPVPVRTLERLGWDSKAFEAIAFGTLAFATLRDQCANIPSATGASRPVLLGTIVPGRPGWYERLRRRLPP
jgi:anhydro-N-acetylmuramic acid kinase